MGNKLSIFTEDQLEAYQDCTFFTRKEILRIFRRFREISPQRVPVNMRDGKSRRENPFRERICQVFSEDGSGDMSFDDFLDMFSVFSEIAPRDIKCVYAFKIYVHFISGSDPTGEGDAQDFKFICTYISY
ncbi:CIB3-like protein [Mya arenaria]|uniref:CIB3-like protein n=1 Tax=Mya arenaria TaxID=6604 RepID=A0ABY7DS53_MYAAR|nr:CIB3-like protein [Mya arenaria]